MLLFLSRWLGRNEEHVDKVQCYCYQHVEPFPVRLGARMSESKMTNLLKASRKYVLQVPTDEFLGTHWQGPIPIGPRSLDEEDHFALTIGTRCHAGAVPGSGLVFGVHETSCVRCS